MLLLALAAVAFWLAHVPIASADTIFSDSFGSQSFSAWNGGAQTGGDGTATVQSAIVCPPSTCSNSPQFAAEFTESANSGSKAYARETFGAGAQMDLTVTGAFDVTQQGASNSNVPLFRLLDPTSARVVSVYRQNVSGTLGVGYGGGNFNTTGKLALGTWATVSVQVDEATNTITVTLNGNTVYQASANLGSAGIETMQIGNDTGAQMGQVYVDSVTAQSTSSTPSPPVNTALPTISGTPQQGQTLTASPGTWTSTTSISYTYQWQRCDASGANCSAISGATGNSYGVTSADVGSMLEVTVVASNAAGSNTATSRPTPVVSGPSSPPANTSPPTIAGTALVGQMLTASPGGWSGAATITYAYQWERCDSSGANCTAIAGATQPTYTVVNQDLDSTLEVVVTASNSAGSANASSVATAAVGTSSGEPTTVASWPMNETSGTTMFDAVGSDNGTFAGHPVKLGVPGSGTGSCPTNCAYGFGTAYGITGHSYVSVPSTDGLNPYNANMIATIELNTTGTPPPEPDDWDVFRKGTYLNPGPWNEFKMELQQDGQISCGFDGTLNGKSVYMELQAGPKVNNGQWHTVQCVKTATAIEVVVDGQVFSQAVKLGSISNTEPVDIGNHGSPAADQYSGALDEASLQFG